jgi:Tetratricopeptide repeat
LNPSGGSPSIAGIAGRGPRKASIVSSDMSSAAPLAREKRAPLEHKRRLSRSLLWAWQREFYCREGVRAWTDSHIPHHITSCSFTAEAYARVAFAFLRDRAAAGGATAAAPVHIVELGSGPGRFAYLFLKSLLAHLRGSPCESVRVRYVMTDVAEKNLAAWQAHPSLSPLFESGVLDLARFEIGVSDELHLLRSGDVLRPGEGQGPLVVIANYVLDSIPQDAFSVDGGELRESLVTLSAPFRAPAPGEPVDLSRLEIQHHHYPMRLPYYDDPLCDRILDEYRSRLPRAAFLFPIAAIAGMRSLLRLSGGSTLFLSGDKGFTRDEAFLSTHVDMLGIVPHAADCFSMAVDYQILGAYCRLRGGEALHPAHRHDGLSVSAFLFDPPPGGFAETRRAYAEAIDRFGPDDFFTLISELDPLQDQRSFRYLLSLLRLSAWDFQILLSSIPRLKHHLPELSPIDRQDLFEAIEHVWDRYLPLPEENDLAFQLGTLLIELQFYGDALRYLERSAALFGLEPGTAYNLALCCYSLRQIEQARQWNTRALELDPDFDEAKALRIRIAAAGDA